MNGIYARGHVPEGQDTMGMREKLSNNPKVTIPVVIAVIVLAVAYGAWSMKSDVPSADLHAFYTVDDGKTFFVDDLKTAPFIKDGKEAVRAYVYECPDGTQFVAYMERTSPAIRKEMDAMKARGEAPDSSVSQRWAEGGTEVKLPNDSKWQIASAFLPKFKVKCPGTSSGDPRLVVP